MTAMFARPKLDRQAAFDPKSRAYAIRPFVAGVTRKTALHEVPVPLPLDQGSEGACVGFGWSAQLAVGPVFNPTNNVYAKDYYEAAREVDRKSGRNYPEGASVLAGAEVARARGLISGYKWGFGIDDVIDTLVAKGPVVLGINWYDAMYNTEVDGKMRVAGSLVGGHCILATGYIRSHPQWGGDWIRLTNSWGPSYGVAGNGFIRVMDLSYLLKQNGEMCIADEVSPTPARPWWYRYFQAFLP